MQITMHTFLSIFRLWYKTAKRRMVWFISAQLTTTGPRYPVLSNTCMRCHPDISNQRTFKAMILILLVTMQLYLVVIHGWITVYFDIHFPRKINLQCWCALISGKSWIRLCDPSVNMCNWIWVRGSMSIRTTQKPKMFTFELTPK